MEPGLLASLHYQSIDMSQVLNRLFFRRIGLMLMLSVIALAFHEAKAQSPEHQDLAGDYFLNEPDVASGIRISADGTYRFFTMVGRVDEVDEGRWQLDGDEIHARSAAPDTPPLVEFVSSEKGLFEGTQIRLIAKDTRRVNGALWIRLDSPAGKFSSARQVEDDLQTSSMAPPIKQLTLGFMGGIRRYGTLVHTPSSPDHNLFTFAVLPGNLGVMRLDDARIVHRGDALLVAVPKFNPVENLVYTRAKPVISAPSAP